MVILYYSDYRVFYFYRVEKNRVMTCITQRNIPITQAKKALSHKVFIT
jgi:hypothetical protein